MHILLLMTKEKQNSETYRKIIDLTCSTCQAVNDGVAKNTYFGSKFKLKYPIVGDIVRKVIELDSGCLLY